MANKQWRNVGSILRSKNNENEFYLKVSEDVSLRKGSILQLQDKKSQLDRLERSLEEGKLTEDKALEIRAAIEKIPSFVRFNVVLPPDRD